MRRFLARLSLRTRLFAALLGVLMAAFLLGGVYALQAARTVGSQALQQMAEREAQVLALTLTEALILDDYTTVEELMRRAATQGGFTGARLMSDGQAIAVEASPAKSARPEWFAQLVALQPAQARQPIVVGGRHYGSIELTVAPNAVEDRLWRLLARIFTVAVVASLLLAVLMAWIMRVNLVGLARIAQASREMCDGRPLTGIRLPDSAPPELVATAQALDAAHARIQAQLEQLATEKERWQVTLEAIADAVIVTDADGRVHFMNPTAEVLTEWEEAEAMGRPIEIVAPLIDESHRQPLKHPVHRVLKMQAHDVHISQALLRTAHGAEIPVTDSASAIRAANGCLHGAVLVLHDETERRALLAELRRLAFHDPLTGLPNRRALEGRIERALRQLRETPHRQHAFCYIDLDQFKLVNDTCGHAAGDELLVEIGQRMQAQLPGPSRGGELPVLGRLGGDEFGLLLFDTDVEAALKTATAIVEAVRAYTYRRDGRSFNLGASIGVALLQAGEDPGQILARADAACYLAKRKGRNRVELWQPHHPVLQVQSEEMEWVGRLERYFAEGRFELWRQRIIPVSGNGAPYYEILLRPRNEQGKVSSPSSLLTAAERYGFAPRLDRWVLSRLLTHLRDHPEDTARYAINLSGQSISDPAFIEVVRSTLEATGVPPQRIFFELTETAVVQDIEIARRFIDDVRALGCGFSLDDFGSGLSSFSYLKQLKASTLKIDGALVRGIDTEPVDYAIVNAIAQIGRDLGIQTVAEFVENATILEKLREIGVDYAQGYHLHAPEPFVAPVTEVGEQRPVDLGLKEQGLGTGDGANEENSTQSTVT